MGQIPPPQGCLSVCLGLAPLHGHEIPFAKLSRGGQFQKKGQRVWSAQGPGSHEGMAVGRASKQRPKERAGEWLSSEAAAAKGLLTSRGPRAALSGFLQAAWRHEA